MEPVFGERLQVQVTDYSILLEFFSPAAKDAAARVALPVVVAKQLCMILRKQLREYEGKLGEIVVPPGSFSAMGVSPEDWEHWLGK